MRKIVIIAGPNGAGKTTFAKEYLPKEAECPEFINVDLIAAGLSPFDPSKAAVRAARLMLGELDRRTSLLSSFAFETTLSGTNYTRMISRWRSRGYHVKLIFLSLPAVELALARVAVRVSLGGHDVPEDVVKRRFETGLRNFHTIYKFLVDSWAFYDNSGPIPRLLTSGDNR